MYINGKKVVIKVVPNMGVWIVPLEKAVKVPVNLAPSKKFSVGAVGGKVLQKVAFFPGPVIISSKILMDLVQMVANASM